MVETVTGTLALEGCLQSPNGKFWKTNYVPNSQRSYREPRSFSVCIDRFDSGVTCFSNC